MARRIRTLARTKATIKIAVSTRITVGAGALSRKKLAYTPRKPDTSVTPTAIGSISAKRFVKRNAIAPGAISNPMDKMIPTAANVATIVKEISANRP